MKSKVCTKCGVEKSLDEFYADKRATDGKQLRCKECCKKYNEDHKEEKKIYNKKYRDVYKEEIVVQKKKYQQGHKEEIKNYKKKYQEDNKEELAVKKKKYSLNHKDEIKIRDKIYREDHKNEIAIQVKKYYEDHKEELKIKAKKYREEHKKEINNHRNNRRKTDIRFRIQCNLSGRINKVLKGKNKSFSTMFLIGCEHDYLIYHLQSQFAKGMNWDNYGKWHVDHIRPCASFDLTNPEEQQKCFHYKNLQPLWAKDNLIKNAKWNKEG